MTRQSDLLEGLSREQYLRQQVRPEGLPVLEEDWRKLLQWVTRVSGHLYFYSRQLEKSGRWDEFWKNQLLVILTDLVLLDTEACKRRFMTNKGTGKEKEALEQLEDFIKDIVARLKRCEYNLILSHRSGEEQRGILEGTASELSGYLEDVIVWKKEREALKLTEQTTANSLFFFRMLDVVCGLQGRYEYYMDRVVKSGETEPALAVLYIFLKNYAQRAAFFNRRLGDFPAFYIREILRSHPRGALPDHTWIVLNKTPEIDSVVVPAGTAFAGGTNEDGSELHYLSAEQVVVTDIQLDRVYSVLLKQSDKGASSFTGNHITALCRREIPLLAAEDAPELFSGGGEEGVDIPVGWMIESPMFDLREGERVVELHLELTAESGSCLVDFIRQLKEQAREGAPEEIFKDAFVVQVCCQEGWFQPEECATQWDAGLNRLLIRFSLGVDMPAIGACTEELHGISTRYPAIQMVLNKDALFFPYSWASQVAFERLTVKVSVERITNLKLYNEFGESDPSVPFYPFGVQARKGAWFVFGNYEMACKPLTKVTLSYNWQQLPSGTKGFAEHYANYNTTPPINNLSFEIRTEWLKDRKWVTQLGTPFLFDGVQAEDRVEECGSVIFWMDKEMPVVNVTEENYGLGKSHNGFLRVVLSAPEMGFGSELYRQLFAKVMINNSRKGKDSEPLPEEPVIPMMSDVELSYEAEDIFSPEMSLQKTGVRFYRLKPLAWRPYLPVDRQEVFMLAEPLETAAHLLFAFRNARGTGLIRMYIDMTMRKDEIGFCDALWENMEVSWYYNDGRSWQMFSSGQVLRENTHVFTHAGLVELALPVPVAEDWLDSEGRFWICASIRGDYRECRLIRGFHVNAAEVVADGGNGTGLAVGTITQSVVSVPGLESVNQIVSGFGGCPAEDEKYLSLRMAHRIAHRGRAVNPVDFERMALEQFPVLEKVRCIPVTEARRQSSAGGSPFVPKIHLVVMSREQEGKYPLCSLVTLQDVRKRLSAGISPFAEFEVSNPVYEKVRIHCRVKLCSPAYVGATLRKLQNKINYYIAPWLFKHEMPDLNRGISLRGLYTILVNEEGVARLESLLLERVDEEDEEKKYEKLELLPEFTTAEGEVVVRESVCGGVFIPDENHVISI